MVLLSEEVLRILDIMKTAFMPMLEAAVGVTLPLAIGSFIIGVVLALILALMRLSKSKVLQKIAETFMTVVRGIPVIVLLFIVYFGLPYVGIVLTPIPSAVLCLCLSEGAYDSEILRSAMLAVSKGQREAARSLGLNPIQVFRYIVFPQAALIAVPPLANSFIGITKTTSLTTVLTVNEIFHVGYKLVAVYYEPLWIYLEIGMFYLVICSALMVGQRALERKLGRHLKALGI